MDTLVFVGQHRYFIIIMDGTHSLMNEIAWEVSGRLLGLEWKGVDSYAIMQSCNYLGE